MRLDVRDDVEVARRPAARPGLALAGEPDLVAVVDARRDRHAQRPLALHAALALAGVAGRLDDAPRAAAATAGGDVDHLAEHGRADLAHLAGAAALRARDRGRCPAPRRCRRRSRRCASAVKAISFSVPWIASSKVSSQVVAEVGARRRPAAPLALGCAPPPKNASKMSPKPWKPPNGP